MAAKSASTGHTIESLVKSIKNKDFSPIYFLFGDEAYYIDETCKYMEDNILLEDEREFNQMVVYGSDITADEIIMNAKRFPMMSEYQVIIVKEAQLLKDFKLFESYFKQPQSTTVLVICYKGKLDKRLKLTQVLFQEYVCVESAVFKQDKMPDWIIRYLRKKNYDIEQHAAIVLSEHTGPDLVRAAMEADKLLLNAPAGYKFTSKDLEKQVGLSKEYSIFELQNALGRRDVFKANSIAVYISKNKKEQPIQAVIGLLYSYFSKILLLHYHKSKGERNLAKAMGVWDSMLKDYEIAARNYSPAKLMHVIHHLRKGDLQSKGFESGSIETEGILQELIFKIVH
jgi:DNA polymerase III subunit delta